jgi:hypothetical protein
MERFYGDDLTPQQYELLAITKVGAPYREIEPTLFNRRWFDYRAWPPAKATYYFADCYIAAAKRFYARTRDVTTADDIKPLDHQDVFQSGERTAMWRARQTFDMLGVRYPWGMDFAFDRAMKRGWHYFPRPNQLYHETLVLDMKDAWAKHCTEIFEPVKSERFRIENFEDHPDQIAFQTWVADQARKRPQPQMLLARLFSERLLPEEAALRMFGPELVRQAKHFASILGISQA